MRYAVVGTNFISHWFCEATKLTNSQPYAVYSRKQETADAFASEFDIKVTYTDFDKMLEDVNIDAVYIASPNFLHFEQAKKALEAGKHVLLEKPATLKIDEFNELCELAKSKNLAFVEAMKTHFTPTFEEIAKVIPTLGEIRRVAMNFCNYSPRYENYKNGIIENAFRRELGNGSLVDIGIYPISILVKLFGKPEAITAKAKILPGSIDMLGTLLCEYPEFHAIIGYSKVNHARQMNEIACEYGSILFDATGVTKGYTVWYNDGRKESFVPAPEDNNMHHEILFMEKCAKDITLADKYHDMTVANMEIMGEGLKQIGYEL